LKQLKQKWCGPFRPVFFLKQNLVSATHVRSDSWYFSSSFGPQGSFKLQQNCILAEAICYSIFLIRSEIHETHSYHEATSHDIDAVEAHWSCLLTSSDVAWRGSCIISCQLPLAVLVSLNSALSSHDVIFRLLNFTPNSLPHTSSSGSTHRALFSRFKILL
jgi:hypothetical protein